MWDPDLIFDTSKNYFTEHVGERVLAPTWGGYKDMKEIPLSLSYLQEAKRAGMKITPLLHNDFDLQETKKFLHDSGAVQNLARQITATALVYDFDGWNLDFENMDEADKFLYTKFIKTVSEKLHMHGKEISVDVTVNSNSPNWSLCYDRKGMAAYVEHAHNLGYQSPEIFAFMQHALAELTRNDITMEELVQLTLETGQHGVSAMAQLDTANTSSYGNPEITEVNIGVRNNPGILISGHDLKDLEELLEQTEGTGIDIYTHSEMLPAHYYPQLKKYKHLAGNYGNAWWKQKEEFESFNGPILFTSNCIVPPRSNASYKDRIYVTGACGLEGAHYIPERKDGKPKDFSALIAHAKQCQPPVAIENGTLIGGFAHAQVTALADKVVEAVKSGAIRKFFVMAGCDGRMKSRDYYTEFAKALPQDTVILTAGCAKYRYNKLGLGDINGIPRVLDAGQCNDSYSLAVIAMKLKEVFQLNDINELPIVYNIAWYEQKAVIVLLALLSLGVKDIHLGPTLPAFLSPNVVKVLVDMFHIAGIGSVEDDLKKFGL